MSLGTDTHRYNADGLLYESQDTVNGRSYLQIFRDGHLEYGDSYSLVGHDDAVPGALLEDRIRDTFGNALALLRRIETEGPIFVSLSLINVKGKAVWLPGNFGSSVDFSGSRSKTHPFDRAVVLSPAVLLQDLREGVLPSILLPVINAVWQALGLEGTPYAKKWTDDTAEQA